MEHFLNNAAWGRFIEIPDSVANGTVGGLLGLPPLLDAVIDKSNESSSHDDTMHY